MFAFLNHGTEFGVRGCDGQNFGNFGGKIVMPISLVGFSSASSNHQS